MHAQEVACRGFAWLPSVSNLSRAVSEKAKSLNILVFRPGGGSSGTSRKRQRLETLPESKTVNKLLELIGRGGSHCNLAPLICGSAWDDGFTSPAVAACRSLGAHGQYGGNIERDLHTWTRGLWGLELEPYEILLPLKAFVLQEHFFCILLF